jgi:hypothetical protein
MGRRVDLPDAMRAKMENAFGADLSAVKLYESEAVAEAGANAVTRGSDIAFAPGMLDFSSYGGQALLGHELSHVVSQARGEVTGGGFLNDRALEARADREGAMAAAGQTVAMPGAALSPVTAAPAAGPMQASKAEGKVEKQQQRQLALYSHILEQKNQSARYEGSRVYQSDRKKLAEARQQEIRWRGKKGGDRRVTTGVKLMDMFRCRPHQTQRGGARTSRRACITCGISPPRSISCPRNRCALTRRCRTGSSGRAARSPGERCSGS